MQFLEKYFFAYFYKDSVFLFTYIPYSGYSINGLEVFKYIGLDDNLTVMAFINRRGIGTIK
jgi:hypothetical protein